MSVMQLSDDEYIVDVDTQLSSPIGDPKYDVVVLSNYALYRYTYNLESNLILVEYYPYDFNFAPKGGRVVRANNLIIAYLTDLKEEYKLITYIPGTEGNFNW